LAMLEPTLPGWKIRCVGEFGANTKLASISIHIHHSPLLF
jgi:GTP-dependent phosphoenolpyruvate carboxykinase